MARKGRVPFRLDIVGLNPSIFQLCLRDNQAFLESRTKGREISASESVSLAQKESNSISKEQLELHSKIASIALDFQRAYGKSVEIRVFERSPNKMLNLLLKGRGAKKEPEFKVNGVRVFKGVPNSFSQLDEAIDRTFGKARS